MPETLPFRQIDAFAEAPFRGNPAGVVLGADGLTDEQMLLIAREVNASETAFVSRLNDLHRPPRVRYFTPTIEVPFCGHATLATAQALYESIGLARGLPDREQRLLLEANVGELRLTMELLPEPYTRPLWWLDMPDAGLKPDNTNPVQTCALLGFSDQALDDGIPPLRTRDAVLIYMVKDWQTLIEATPRFDELRAWCERHHIQGICVATTNTLTESIDVQSRFFAPALGINEDPVTGSVHGPLAVALVVNGVVGSVKGMSALNCLQGRPGDRGGLVRVLVESTPRGYHVKVGGVCFTTIVGDIAIPPKK